VAVAVVLDPKAMLAVPVVIPVAVVEVAVEAALSIRVVVVAVVATVLLSGYEFQVSNDEKGCKTW
jgi:hypothetical protein